MATRPPLRSQQSPPAEAEEFPTGRPGRPEEAVQEAVTVVDEMAADARRPEKPAGSPQLWPYAQLPRRMRADFFERIRSFDKFQGRLDVQGDTISSVADVMTFVADAEDALRIVAHQRPVFDAWVDTADDQDLTDLLMWYIDRFQVGEVKGS